MAYATMRREYHMSDDEFWHHLAPGRLFILMGLDSRKREDDLDLKMLELHGF